MNNYYDVNLKKARLKILQDQFKNSFEFFKVELENRDILNEIFSLHKPSEVVNLAAQAGVRYSLINPYSYVQSNLVDSLIFLNAAEITESSI